MADIQIYTNEAAAVKATDIKAALATSKLRLFKEGLVLDRFTTAAMLEAAECDFDGYTAGGYTLTAWTGPANDPNGGAVLTSPLVNPAYSTPSDPPVPNQVAGWWVEDSDGAVRLAGTYDPPRSLAVVGDSFPVVIQIVEARNPVGV